MRCHLNKLLLKYLKKLHQNSQKKLGKTAVQKVKVKCKAKKVKI